MSAQRGGWQEEARILSEGFYPEVLAAFGFLETNYGYRFVDERLMWPEDYRDSEAQVRFVGADMGVMAAWYFTSGIINVYFRKLHTSWHYPEELNEEERRSRLPVSISLYSLARYLGSAQDPDFVLGDIWNVYESKCKKRDALIKGNLRGVLAGLARATERYADAILNGDSSQFAQVAAYHNAHQDDYWKRK